MQSGKLRENASYIYLSLIPFLTAAFGFGVGQISYKIYVPLWIVNVILMLGSAVLAWVASATERVKIEVLGM